MKTLLLWWVIVNGVPVLGGVESIRGDLETCHSAAGIWREILPEEQQQGFVYRCTPGKLRWVD